MHQEINKSRRQKGLCMRISASSKHGARTFQAKFTELMKENVHRGALL